MPNSTNPNFCQPIRIFLSPGWKIAIGSLTTSTLATLAEKLLCIIDGRASYCVYATNNGNSMIWFLFRVALVSEDIRLIYHMHGAHDLRETRRCIIDTVLEKKESINYQF